MRHYHFIAPALSCNTKRCAAVNPFILRSEAHALTRSTKDRKKGCAYDPGALNKQGALKSQTLRYVRGRITYMYVCAWCYLRNYCIPETLQIYLYIYMYAS